MKYVPPTALFFGAILLLLSALAVFGFWLQESYGSSQVILPQPPYPGFEASLSEATSLEGLKSSCLSIAKIYDTQSTMIRAQDGHISYLYSILQRGVLIGGAVLGLAFLYIYFATRKHVLPTRP